MMRPYDMVAQNASPMSTPVLLPDHTAVAPGTLHACTTDLLVNLHGPTPRVTRSLRSNTLAMYPAARGKDAG